MSRARLSSCTERNTEHGGGRGRECVCLERRAAASRSVRAAMEIKMQPGEVMIENGTIPARFQSMDGRLYITT
jgi:hypothetical protein